MPNSRFEAAPAPTSFLQQGSVRQHPTSRNSQAHPGVSALHGVTHRNTSFQPLPRPLGLPPVHYSLATNFPSIVANMVQRQTTCAV